MSKLNTRHQQILALLLYSTKSRREIAQELDYSEAHLSRVINSPLFQVELERLTLCREKEQRDIYIQKLANRCLEIVDAVLNSGQVDFEQSDRKLGIPASVLLETVRDVLDRAGHKPGKCCETAEAEMDLSTIIELAWQPDDAPNPSPAQLHSGNDLALNVICAPSAEILPLQSVQSLQ